MRRAFTFVIVVCCLLPLSASAKGQGVDVSAKISVNVEKRGGGSGRQMTSAAANVVLWLTPLQPVENIAPVAHAQYTLTQRNKQFTPHLLVVPKGSSVEFPNADPFFHNVFSLYSGKRFDLGLYEPGKSRSVRFDREGVSYIFCNIHPQMGAVVLALSTPFYAGSGGDGFLVINHVPPGSYRVSVWSERAKLADSESLSRVIQVSTSPVNLGQIPMTATDSTLDNHKNKFGDDYVAPKADPY
jgi:plastocyanin